MSSEVELWFIGKYFLLQAGSHNFPSNLRLPDLLYSSDMAGLKFAFLLGLMALFTLMEQTKPVAGGRRVRIKKLTARVDDLEARLGTIEECKCKSFVLFSFTEIDSGRTKQWNFVDTV